MKNMIIIATVFVSFFTFILGNNVAKGGNNGNHVNHWILDRVEESSSGLHSPYGYFMTLSRCRRLNGSDMARIDNYFKPFSSSFLYVEQDLPDKNKFELTLKAVFKNENVVFCQDANGRKKWYWRHNNTSGEEAVVNSSKSTATTVEEDEGIALVDDVYVALREVHYGSTVKKTANQKFPSCKGVFFFDYVEHVDYNVYYSAPVDKPKAFSFFSKTKVSIDSKKLGITTLEKFEAGVIYKLPVSPKPNYHMMVKFGKQVVWEGYVFLQFEE